VSQLLIQQYLNELQDLRRVSGTTRESVVSEAFKDLLKGWGRAHDLIFVPQYEIETPAKQRRVVDGALLHELRVPFGYWEAKDEEDDLDQEIERKFRRGYPQDNIVFEDSRHAVLIQNRQEVTRCGVDDPARLQHLLDLFFGYERTEIAEFRKAVAQFKADLPAVLGALREMIEKQLQENAAFRAAANAFLRHAQETINPNVTDADVREMLIQHILTEEIFSKVFDEDDFHCQNNVARKLYALEGEFFTGGVKKHTLKGLEPYYAAIRAAAAQISSHHEKQTFLKVIYENFYKIYNPKAADRLGVIYTPNEIVRFMIESADWLCERHFGKRLIDKDVEILDPAAGTGTFITELIEHFRGQRANLKHKYLEELHANEVAILPYYVANLNIEATYAATAGEYEEFPNLCFVDTLDNVAPLRAARGSQGDLFGGISEENVARIKRQNARKISVIIGNPPYNANQLNENENNKNREYLAIDHRIKATYIKASTAQKTKLYDMYARFFRWASDRVDDNGIVAFVSNRSFIESRTFDGFRKTVADEFNDIYVVDLGGDVRADPRLSGTKHNVFGIQTGVAISFMVRRANTKGCRIRYSRRPQLETAEEKRAFLGNVKLDAIVFEEIVSSVRHDWLNQTTNDFDTLLPMATKQTKSTKRRSLEQAIFKLFANGVNTARDEWVYAFDESELISKMQFAAKIYNGQHHDIQSGEQLDRNQLDTRIKWSAGLINNVRSKPAKFSTRYITRALYRPFTRVRYYASDIFSDRLTSHHASICGENYNKMMLSIAVSAPGTAKSFSCLAVTNLADWHFLGDTQIYPLHRIVNGAQIDNITDWGLKQFLTHYETALNKRQPKIIKEAIFYYVYGVLHDLLYREKYAINLKREFPRIPFYADFWRWADWGETLMDLHIGYETIEPWPLRRLDTTDERSRKAGLSPRVTLKANKGTGIIQLDSETQLTGVPREAWDYRLGNRSALEWILDQHKEKTPRDATIRELFNTYRFADHKEKVIDLLMRVTRVSVETVAIIEAMRQLPRG
jgi:predicted helicase